eukprot:ANDGO_07883.mRNA.1 hypothetical protein
MRWSPLVLNNVTQCAADVDSFGALYTRLKLEQRDASRSSVLYDRISQELSQLVSDAQDRMLELQDFIRMHDHDSRAALFEKQRRKLMKIVQDYVRDPQTSSAGLSHSDSHIESLRLDMERDRERSASFTNASVNTFQNSAAVNNSSSSNSSSSSSGSSRAGAGGNSGHGFNHSTMSNGGSSGGRRLQPRLSYSTGSTKPAKEMLYEASLARKKVKPLYDWENTGGDQAVYYYSADASASRTPQRSGGSPGRSGFFSPSMNETISVSNQIPFDLCVRMTRDEFENFQRERQEFEERLQTQFLKKRTGHLAYTRQSAATDEDRLFLTSRGPFREPILTFKDEDKSKWVGESDFRVTGFQKIPENGSPYLPRFINAGIPYQSANPDTLKQILREESQHDKNVFYVATKRTNTKDRTVPLGGYTAR